MGAIRNEFVLELDATSIQSHGVMNFAVVVCGSLCVYVFV